MKEADTIKLIIKFFNSLQKAREKLNLDSLEIFQASIATNNLSLNSINFNSQSLVVYDKTLNSGQPIKQFFVNNGLRGMLDKDLHFLAKITSLSKGSIQNASFLITKNTMLEDFLSSVFKSYESIYRKNKFNKELPIKISNTKSEKRNKI